MSSNNDANSVAANVLGTIGTILWCVQLIPQIIFNYRKKNTEGLPPLMLFLWCAAGVPFSIYFISTRASIPVQVQPEVFTLFCTITWVQTLYYPPVQYPIKKIILIVGSFTVCAIALEASLIVYFTKKYGDKVTGKEPGLLFFGIIASILIAVGLLPPYFELLKRNGRVVGINFIFLAVDCGGALFSMFSVIFGNMDVMGISLYCICAALEIGIFLSHFIWCLRFKWFGKNKINDDNSDSSQVERIDDDEDDSDKRLDHSAKGLVGLEKTVSLDGNLESKDNIEV